MYGCLGLKMTFNFFINFPKSLNLVRLVIRIRNKGGSIISLSLLVENFVFEGREKLLELRHF